MTAPSCFSRIAAREGWPYLATVAVLVWMVLQLRFQGRTWFCSCGQVLFWSENVWSRHNSQHLADPYSFTHVLHGIVFCGLLLFTVPRLSPHWRLFLAMSIECLWEILENTALVIDRYRAATAAVGYEGDSVVNSLGDVLCCAGGFLIARRLGWARSIGFFALMEVVLLFWIRDNLTLNVIMLLFPIDAIKAWQTGMP